MLRRSELSFTSRHAFSASLGPRTSTISRTVGYRPLSASETRRRSTTSNPSYQQAYPYGPMLSRGAFYAAIAAGVFGISSLFTTEKSTPGPQQSSAAEAHGEKEVSHPIEHSLEDRLGVLEKESSSQVTHGDSIQAELPELPDQPVADQLPQGTQDALAPTPTQQETESQEVVSEREMEDILFARPLLLIQDEPLAIKVFSKFASTVSVAIAETREFHGTLAEIVQNYPALLYYYNPLTGGLEVYAMSEDQLLSVDTVVADIENRRLPYIAATQDVEEALEEAMAKKEAPLVLTRETFEDTVNADKDVFVLVHFGLGAWSSKLADLTKVLSSDDSVTVACYDTTMNLPFPPSLMKGTHPEWVKEKESFFQYFPRKDKDHPIRFAVEDNTLLEMVVSICKQRNAGLPEIAQLLHRASVQKSVSTLAELEMALGAILHTRKAQLESYRKGTKPTEEGDKLLVELEEIRKVTGRLEKHLKMTAEDYKAETRELNKRLSNAMYALQQQTLKHVEKLPERNFQEALQRLCQEAAGEGKDRVVVFFSRKGCPPCFELSFYYARLVRLFPNLKFAWANAEAVDLEITPRCFVYESGTGKEQEQLNFKGCVLYFSKLRKEAQTKQKEAELKAMREKATALEKEHETAEKRED